MRKVVGASFFNWPLSTEGARASADSSPELMVPDADVKRSSCSQMGSALRSRALLIQSRFAGTMAVAVCAALLCFAGAGSASAQSPRSAPPAAALSSSAPVAAKTDPTVLSGKLTRNDRVQEFKDQLETSCLDEGLASTAVFLPGNGQKYDAWSFSYHTGHVKEMNLLKVPKDGIMRGTIVINVSCHTDQGEQFAKTNTYSVRIELPDGTVLTRSGIPRNVVSDRSKASDTPEYVTVFDFEYPYQSGVTVVSAWPDGTSAGGYVEGRIYDVHSVDKPFDVNKQRAESLKHPWTDDDPSGIPEPYRE
jgi:hypothetical protein